MKSDASKSFRFYLNTFIDQLINGDRLNERTPLGLVERVQLGEKTWLWYKAFPIHVGEPPSQILSEI